MNSSQWPWPSSPKPRSSIMIWFETISVRIEAGRIALGLGEMLLAAE